MEGAEVGGRFLIITNISKKKNVAQLLDTATVYGFVPVLVNSEKIRESLTSEQLESLLIFDGLKTMREYMKSRQVTIVGIEIIEGAVSLDHYTFPESIALMPGNEGSGMSSTQIRVCDEFVYIPQYGVGTASLNVHVATGIILHHSCRQALESR